MPGRQDRGRLALVCPLASASLCLSTPAGKQTENDLPAEGAARWFHALADAWKSPRFVALQALRSQGAKATQVGLQDRECRVGVRRFAAGVVALCRGVKRGGLRMGVACAGLKEGWVRAQGGGGMRQVG